MDLKNGEKFVLKNDGSYIDIKNVVEQFSSIIGIIACKVRVENNVVQQVSAVVSDGKVPKLVARDIEVIASVILDIPIDYKRIAIAMVKGYLII